MERAVRYLWIASMVSAPFLAMAVYVPTSCMHWLVESNPRGVFVTLSRYESDLAVAMICLSVIFLALAIPRQNRHVGCAQVTMGASCLSAAGHRLLDNPSWPHVYYTIFTVLVIQTLSGWTKAVGWADRGETEHGEVTDG